MKHSVLVADGDRAFATILREALEATGDYAVTVVPTAHAALDAVLKRTFDMVIVDSMLADVPLPTMVESLRASWPAIRVMLIPRANNRIPTELQAVEVQGLLPKPFFVGDLPAIVRHAMDLDDAIPLARLAELADEAPAATPEADAEAFFDSGGATLEVDLPDLLPLDKLAGDEYAALFASKEPAAEAEEIRSLPVEVAADSPIGEPVEKADQPGAGGREREALAAPPPLPVPSPASAMSPLPEPEVVADAVAVRERTVEPSEAAEPPPSAHDAAELARIIQSLQRELLARAVLVTSGERVLASGGSIGGAELAELAQLIAGRVAASGRLMQFLGEPQGVVELVLEEGRDVRVYTVRVTTAVCLTVAAAPSIPLGTLRYRTRQAAEEIVAALR